MARNRGWWALELENNSYEELTDTDREHIARLIIEGYTNGEIMRDEECEEQ